MVKNLSIDRQGGSFEGFQSASRVERHCETKCTGVASAAAAHGKLQTAKRVPRGERNVPLCICWYHFSAASQDNEERCAILSPVAYLSSPCRDEIRTILLDEKERERDSSSSSSRSVAILLSARGHAKKVTAGRCYDEGHRREEKKARGAAVDKE